MLKSTGVFIDTHGFTGKDWDADVGLYYFNARWYDPDLGRFISQDTYLGTPDEPQTLNLYTYCYNNPLINTDPTGHDVGFTQNPVCNPDYQQRLIDLHNKGYSWEEVDKVVKAETTIPGFKFDPWKAKSSCTPLNLENQIQLYLILQVQRAEFLKDEKLSLIEKAKLWLLKQQLTLAFNWLNIQTGIYNLLHENDRGYFYTSEQIESALYDVTLLETLAVAGIIQYAIDSRQLQAFSATTATTEEQIAIGRVEIPQGIAPGTTEFGNKMHERIAAWLTEKFKGSEFIIRVKPGETGVDVTYVGGKNPGLIL